jgi:hypothetical protein
MCLGFLGADLSDYLMIEWTVYPIRNNWKVSVGLVLFLVILCVAIYLSFDSATFLLLSAVLLISSLSPFFFPTKYMLQDDCVVIKSLFRTYSRKWDSFKSYYPDKNGVLLSPFPVPSRLENFRGMYVRFGDNRAEAMDFIESRIREGGSEKARQPES